MEVSIKKDSDGTFYVEDNGIVLQTGMSEKDAEDYVEMILEMDR